MVGLHTEEVSFGGIIFHLYCGNDDIGVPVNYKSRCDVGLAERKLWFDYPSL